jgi:hypothetical protein
MHIAVLVFGRLNKCIEHYDNILDSIGKEHTIDFFMSSDNSSEYILNEFIRVYQPKSYTNEKIEYTCEFNKYEGVSTNVDSMTRHFINKKRVFELFETYMENTNNQYDVVLSLRIDVVIHNHFIFNTIEKNTIYVPEGYDYIENALNDQIAYGNSDVMKKYNNIFTLCDLLLEQKYTIPHPESLTLANLKYHNVDICRVNLQYHIDK